MKSRALAIAALVLLAGCGGGGGSSPATAPAPQGPQPGGTPQTINMTISFPLGAKPSSSKRAPQYVSPNSTQIRVQVNTVNGSAPPAWVPSDVTTALNFGGGGNCTTSGAPPTATCTIPVAAPPGSVNYTITAEDAVPNALARKTTTLTIVQGTNNTPTVTLLGIVKTVNISIPALTANTSATGATVTWSALDASGAQIVGSANFENPITVTDGDATGQTTLHVNGGAPNTVQTLNAPGDALTIDYTGQADNPFSITASGTGITGSGNVTPTVFDVVLSGTTDDTAANGGLNTDSNFNAQTLFFAQPSGAQNVSATETGWTGAPYSKQYDLDPGNGTGGTCGTGGGIATFSASPATTFTITAHGVGVCSVRLKEHGTGYPITSHTANPVEPTPGGETHDGTFYISVTSANFTVNGKQHKTQ
ncbi:MAG TPA: hypothetical protein VK669_13390 [Candidatus Limnocylindrales bacterium]|nr:hypothetical protein [Candidatus Limnocylindrales bacterium]